jgi:hypothetical protein
MMVIITVSKDGMRVRSVCMTVGVAVGGNDGLCAKLFLQAEERLEDLLTIMEIVVHDVDEHRVIHYVRDELA